MGKGHSYAGRRLALTAAIGAAAAVLFWFGQGGSAPSESVSAAKTGLRLTPVLNQDDAVALRYARAYQAGDCDRVIGLTGWMQERVGQAGLESAEPQALDALLDELRARIQDRPVEGNRLRPEGVEDGYVFAQGATVDFDSSDRGRKDLSKPVQERVWLLVTYPAADRALCDETGKAIRSIRVGVNVSPDSYVVKAGVVGNLDIDRDSISYWADDQGG